MCSSDLSAAGILGPVLVNYINDSRIRAGVPRNAAYDTTLYVLAGLLAGGFVCNLLVRPVAAKWFMTYEELDEERHVGHDAAGGGAQDADGGVALPAKGRGGALVAAFWLLVGVPLAWGFAETMRTSWALFR